MATLTATVAMSVRSTQSIHRLLVQPDGRDKLIRLIQYVCKMVPRSDVAAAVERTLSSSRQVGRLFKWVSGYMTLRRSMHVSGRSSAEHACSLAHDLAMLSYYVTDNAALSAKLGLLRADAKRLAKHSVRLWFVSLIAGLSLSALRIHSTQQRIASLARSRVLARVRLGQMKQLHAETNGQRESHITQTKANCHAGNGEEDEQEEEDEDEMDERQRQTLEELKQLKSVRNVRALTTFKQVCDLSVASNGSFDLGMHQSFVGLCGTLSSLVGLYQTWPSSSSS